MLLILRTNDCQQSITFVCANRSVNFAVVAAAILCFCLLKLEWKWCFSTWDKCKIQWLLIYLRMSIRRHAKTNSTYFTSYLAFKKLAWKYAFYCDQVLLQIHFYYSKTRQQTYFSCQKHVQIMKLHHIFTLIKHFWCKRKLGKSTLRLWRWRAKTCQGFHSSILWLANRQN